MSTLNAEIRERTGKSSSKTLRNQGKTPAIIYANDNQKQTLISLDSKDLFVEYQKGRFFARVSEIVLDGEKIKVIPKEIDFHPVKDTPIHADFLRVTDDTKVIVSVPVKFINKERSPGLKRGGVLNAVRRTIEISCAVKDIPECLIADIGKMKIRDNIKYSELEIPEGIEPVIKDRDFTVASISGRITEQEKSTDTEESSTEAEEENSEEEGNNEE
jgi:large subunit ribosomal protein L25